MKGQGVITEQWVPVDPGFARAHPLGRHLGGVWLVVIWVGLHAFGVIWALVGHVLVQSSWAVGLHLLFGILLVLLLVIDGFALLALLARHPLARVLVWVVLILSFPLSIPLIFYWADGVKPNLIYAHRFERMVVQKGGK
ncbi:MAG: hypothetical protein Q4G26_11665 [Paracoccus sp. (in: a-proteobacteria)]|nr:hypothetical protein [Paracoccus sp. (in: a-proteobacteria)]